MWIIYMNKTTLNKIVLIFIFIAYESILTAPYSSCNLSYIHISTLNLFLIRAIWCAPYFAVKNFSLFFSSPVPPPKLTCLFGVAGATACCLWFVLLDDVILDEEEFILDEFCNLDVAEMDDEEDTDEFADELPESVDDITPEDG